MYTVKTRTETDKGVLIQETTYMNWYDEVAEWGLSAISLLWAVILMFFVAPVVWLGDRIYGGATIIRQNSYYELEESDERVN